jgi:hypothetical protein
MSSPAAAADPVPRSRLKRIRSAPNGPLPIRSCAVVGTLTLSSDALPIWAGSVRKQPDFQTWAVGRAAYLSSRPQPLYFF